MSSTIALPGRVDFHLHSYASNVTTYYAANAFAIPESYSDPVELHRLLKERGMSLVTLTDHNAIDGAKLLLDRGYDDVFLSAEMTATFPEDGCNVHVTIANVTEEQFREANRLRPNLYEMIAYLDGQIADQSRKAGGNEITYFMTHPLMSTENRAYGREGSLTLEHIEKMLLLVPGFEIRNGSRTRALNETTLALLEALDSDLVDRLANKHDLAPKGPTPWRKFVTGGSDDHSGINPGRTWTEFTFEGPRPTANDLVACMRRRETRPGGAFGGPITLAHTILKLLYDGSKRANPKPRTLKARLGLERVSAPQTVGVAGALTDLLDLVFGDGDGERTLRDDVEFQLRSTYHQLVRLREPKLGVPFEKLVESEIYSMLSEREFRETLRAPSLSTDDRIFLVVSTLINRVFVRYVENLRRARAGNVADTIREIVSLVTSHVVVSAPYFAAFQAQSKDSRVSRDVRDSFGLGVVERIALFTDTLFEVNGISATIRRVIRESERRNVEFTVVACLNDHDRRAAMRDPETRRLVESGRIKLFVSVTEMAFPEYDDLKVRFPPLLEVLRFLQEGGFTKVHVSTPATVGIFGLVAAKILELETAATYHTSVPEYVENYTRDISLEDLAWKYMLLFYHAVDEVLVPSRYIAKLLHKRGLRNRKLLILDRWVDVERFHPGARDPRSLTRIGVPDDAGIVKFVYLGRLGVEKNLALLASAFRKLHARHPNVHLVILGDGPFREELERLLAGLPATFTGFLQGDQLVETIASCDVKVFPSTTDTWGNAPLEAQACGLPVIVSEVGGPSELVDPGKSAFKISGKSDDELASVMARLLDGALRETMGRAARAFAVAHRVDDPFTAILDSRLYRRRIATSKDAPRSERVPMTTQVLDLASRDFVQVLETGGSEVIA